MFTMGIDIGSTSSKAVILEDGTRVAARKVIEAGIGSEGPDRVFADALSEAGITHEEITRVMATGYGRMTFHGADDQASELSCHGKGIHYLIPEARVVIDIGGQDAKVMQINERGTLLNFVMNDKCAAGTGRFLDVMAGILSVQTSELAELAAKAEEPLSISSVCTVFAESEVISHLAAGATRSDVAAGIHQSVAKRVAGLGNRIGFRGPIAMSGGVALNAGVVRALEHELGRQIVTHPDAQLAGAYGAAILAFEKETM
ncbi:acyl-CoA dehydratase activase [Ventrimonas sp. CLA-AP-H27]|uniref:Acyl-CoA dehydratase activase n=1 Tax=Ventrimonas faecis TaxID=3133170 RepID=A0ABV1HP53_9FIRM